MELTTGETVAQIFSDQNWVHWGWTPLSKPLSIDVYAAWISEGLHGEMDYLKEHLALKSDPHSLRPRVRSAFVVAQPYLPHPWPQSHGPRAGVALYALGSDYHYQLKVKLDLACQELKAAFPEHEFYIFTDSAPILERDLAYRAGLGWFGKNTCLIDREGGSLFFIAEILTTMDFSERDVPELSRDFCGTCTRCIDVCPTSAIVEDRTLDATQCISYWTIESSEVPDESLRSKFGGWVFGCDLCQTVCPWNIRLHGKDLPTTHTASRAEYLTDMTWILSSTSGQLQRQLKGTPLARAAGNKLRRNALIAIANLGLFELKSLVEDYQTHEKLGELATWTLKILTASERVET